MRKNAYFKPFSATLLLLVILLVIPFSSAVTDEDLISYHSFNDGSGSTVINNVSGTGTNLNIVNTDYSWTTGKIGGSVNITGTSGGVVRINYTDVTDYQIGSQDFTLNYWARLNADGGANNDPEMFIMRGGGVQLVGPVYIQNIGSSDNIRWGNPNFIGGNYVDDRTWKMFTIIKNGTDCSLYYESVFQFLNDCSGVNFNTVSNMNFGNVLSNSAFEGAVAIDEAGFWMRELSQDDIDDLWNGGSGIGYSGITQVINIDLDGPTNNSVFSDVGNIFNSSGTLTTDYNFTNITYYIWNDSGVFNETYIDVVDNNTFNESQFIDSFEEDDYIWNVYACYENATSGAFVECVYAQNNFTFTVGKMTVISQDYNNVTTEGASETFELIFDFLEPAQVSTVTLVYNGTDYSAPYSTVGNRVTAQRSISIPLLSNDANITFFWNVTFNDDTFSETSSLNQTVLNFNVDDCSSYSNLIYNLTLYDEESQTVLGNENTIELQIDLYDASKTTLFTSFSKNYTNVNPAQFCSESSILETVNYSAYLTARYYANVSTDDYAIEYHNRLNETIGNFTVPINVPLYDLKESQATKFRLTFRDSFYVLAPNIIVNVYRQYVSDNEFKIVEAPLTDSNGQTILNLVRNNVVYNFIMTNEEGEVVGTFNSVRAFCQDFTIDDCTINLAPDPASLDAYNYESEFDVSFTSPSYDNDTKEISMTFVTGDLSTKTVSMIIERNNQFGNRSVCSDTLLSASGTLSCDVSAITNTDQFLFISVYVEGSLARQYTINLNGDTMKFPVINGSFYALLIMLFMVLMFGEDKKTLVISLGVGWAVVLSLGLLSGALIGFASSGIWLLVTISIFLWKLNKENSPQQ